MVGTGSYQTIWGPPLPNVTRHSGWWPHTVTTSIDRTLHQFLTITDLDLITEFDFYLIVQGFHRTYATGAACQQRTLTPPDTWSCPTLGLACVLMSRPISPELVLSPDFWISNTPRYFSTGLTTPVGLLVTPTDRPKSVRNRCVIEVFGGVCVCCPLVFEFSDGIGFLS